MTTEELAEAMKSEIIADVKSGIVPATVGSFSELHDYVDANCYGGTEKLLDDVGMDACLALCNPAMDKVDAWIKSGALRCAS